MLSCFFKGNYLEYLWKEVTHFLQITGWFSAGKLAAAALVTSRYHLLSNSLIKTRHLTSSSIFSVSWPKKVWAALSHPVKNALLSYIHHSSEYHDNKKSTLRSTRYSWNSINNIFEDAAQSLDYHSIYLSYPLNEEDCHFRRSIYDGI
jgi:hypothetical protein